MREHIFSRHPLLVPFFGGLSGTLLEPTVILVSFIALIIIIKARKLPYSKFILLFSCFSMVTSINQSLEFDDFNGRILRVENGKEVVFQVKQIRELSSSDYLIAKCSLKSIDEVITKGNVNVIVNKRTPVSIGGVYYARYNLIHDTISDERFTLFNYSRDLLGVMIVKEDDIYSLEGYFFNTFAFTEKIKKVILGVSRNYLTDFSNNLYQRTFLGIKNNFSIEQLKGFKVAGVMHALTISGMHLAIIFGVLISPVKLLMRKWNITKWLKLLILPFLWLYSEITGGAPPVERALIFISISVLCSLILNRKIRIKDLIFTVGILFLIFQPNSIFDVSVQLSFSAVFGIAWIVPLLKLCWIPKNLALDFIWSSICMTIGCTISTVPFILYYFGEISSGFLLGNLILGPLLTIWVIICLVVSVLVLMNYDFFYVFGYKIMNTLSSWIEYVCVQFNVMKIPIFRVNGFTFLHLVICYIFIVGCLIFFINLEESKSDKIL